MRVLDLFSGIGGMSLGLERAGMTTVAFCEIEEFPRRLLAQRWPEVPCYEDVTTAHFGNVGPVDLVAGGFPCQDISFAGPGAGLAGERSGLFWHILRTVRMVGRPKLLLENVAALLGRGMGSVLGALAQIGYDTEWHCIPASSIGAPHRRDRVWIVAHPRGEQHEGDCAPIGGKIAKELLGANSHTSGERCLETWELRHQQSPEWSACLRKEMAHTDCHDAQGQQPCVIDKEIGCGPLGGSARPRGDGNGWWATEPDVGRVAHGVPARVDRLKGLGNAVVPQIPELIGRAIMEAAE